MAHPTMRERKPGVISGIICHTLSPRLPEFPPWKHPARMGTGSLKSRYRTTHTSNLNQLKKPRLRPSERIQPTGTQPTWKGTLSSLSSARRAGWGDAAGAPTVNPAPGRAGPYRNRQKELLKGPISPCHHPAHQKRGYFGGLPLFKATYLVMSPWRAPRGTGGCWSRGSGQHWSSGRSWPRVKPLAAVLCPPRAKFGLSFREGGH